MFESTIIQLLEGQFICEVSAPETFRKLNSDFSFQQEVREYLDKIGRTLTKTPNHQAYYVTWKHVSPNQRADVKQIFTRIKHSIRPVIHFLTLWMEVEKKDSSPIVGDRLDYPLLLNAITNNMHLFESLRDFVTMGKEFTVTDSSAKSMLNKVISQMEKWGYLILISHENASYRFTGKLDYYYQIIDFLIENEGIADSSHEQENEPDNRRLI